MPSILQLLCFMPSVPVRWNSDPGAMPIMAFFMTKDFLACKVFIISLVGIATGYRLDDERVGVRVPVGSRIFSSPRRPNRLWGPPNLLSNWYRG
jgi:hypothetical protein